MKKIKQILAILGVLLLLSLYITTFVMALTDNTETMQLFKASLFATFVVPVLMWVYSLIYKLANKNSKSKDFKASNDSKKASDN